MFTQIENLEDLSDVVPLKKYLNWNQYGTVIDLEEEQIELRKFISADYMSIKYIEVDARYGNDVLT